MSLRSNNFKRTPHLTNVAWKSEMKEERTYHILFCGIGAHGDGVVASTDDELLKLGRGGDAVAQPPRDVHHAVGCCPSLSGMSGKYIV